MTKWIAFEDQDQRERAGVLVGDNIHVLEPGATIVGLLGDDGEHLARAAEHAVRDPDAVIDLESVRPLPPVSRPGAFRDHYAFEEHVRVSRKRRGLEMDPAWFELPVFYFSNPHNMMGATDPVCIPPGTAQLDFELEIGAVVGRDARDVKAEDAAPYLAGFMILNDWSARDLQRREMGLSLGPHKGKDFATTIGPWLVTPDELEDVRQDKAFNLRMRTTVNGKAYSNANLAQLHYSFEEFLEYESRAAVVRAGDIIGSGTCPTGCILELSESHGEDEYPWLQPGDVVELSVDRLGSQRATVLAPEPCR